MLAPHNYEERASKVTAPMVRGCGLCAHGQRKLLELQPSHYVPGSRSKAKAEEGSVLSFLRILSGYCTQYFFLYLIKSSSVMGILPALREDKK